MALPRFLTRNIPARNSETIIVRDYSSETIVVKDYSSETIVVKDYSSERLQ